MTALKYLEGDDEKFDEHWPFLLAIFQASQISPFEVTDITYREIQQAGHLSLLKSQKLRQNLAEYYSFNDGIAALTLLKVNPPYRNYVRGKFPISVTDYIWTNCFQNSDFAKQKLIECTAPIPDESIYKILVNIKSDQKVVELLRSWHVTMQAALDLLPEEKEMVTSLLKMLSDELNE
ncbi:MAG: hypothetical protein OEY96_05590 [Gammaproteobacteria bacterium]|nr:hypothetical protein [Gammaproteobacteria bacterium]